MKLTTMPAKPFRKALSRRALSQLSRLACLATLSGALALTGAAAAHAQMYNLFGSTDVPRLTDGDYKIASATVVKLLNETPAKAGLYEHWSNPATGNSGKFTILSLYTMDAMPCRRVTSYVVYNKDSGFAPRSLTLGACQVASGEWKTTP
jgi:hypothetical protein